MEGGVFMDRKEALFEMIRNRDLNKNESNQEKFDTYIEAWELIVDSEELAIEEIPLLVASLFNKPSYPEFLHPLLDLIVLGIENEEDFLVFMNAILRNREGIRESSEILYSTLGYHKYYSSSFLKRMKVLKRDNAEDFIWYSTEMRDYAIDSNKPLFLNLLSQLD
jgi:hypothetical protein